MIADASGVQPDVLRIEADQKFYFSTLAGADAVVQGRNSYEGGPDARKRRRLIMTRKIAALAPEPKYPKAMLWNPAGASLDEAWRALGLSGGVLAAIGGTDVFGYFLEYGYDTFHLSRAPRARLPGGRPVFPGVPARTPEDLLASHRLKAGPVRQLDEETGANVVTWQR